MDGDLLRSIYHGLRDLGMMHTYGCTYSDGLIIIIELVRQSLHLSAREALTHPHLPLWIRRMGLPGISQFNRRVKTPGVQEGLSRFNQITRWQLPPGDEKICDGKPLIVGGFSKNPDARTGHAPGGWAKGYKLHLVADPGGAVETWRITPLNTCEGGVERARAAEGGAVRSSGEGGGGGHRRAHQHDWRAAPEPAGRMTPSPPQGG